MLTSRTLIRVSAMAVLAAGPTVAAVIAPSVPQEQAPRPAASSVLRVPGSVPPSVPGPVRLTPRKAVARKAGDAASASSSSLLPAADPAPASASSSRPVVRPLPQAADRPKTHADRWIVHRVRDGDSLERLAAKYLGNPARAEEILLWNCDRIDDPAMLPLGVELLIPCPGF